MKYINKKLSIENVKVQNIAKKFKTKLETLENVLNNSHVISLHIPLTQETNNLINTEIT